MESVNCHPKFTTTLMKGGVRALAAHIVMHVRNVVAATWQYNASNLPGEAAAGPNPNLTKSQ